MKQYEKEEYQAYLNSEKATISSIKKTYEEALAQVDEKIRVISTRTDIENMPSIIYQKKYQEQIKEQLEDILGKLQENQFKTVNDYLNDCYSESFLRSLYSLNQQGIPFAWPIDQKAVERAVTLDSKISGGLYSSIGVDVATFKKKITSEISRGIASSLPYSEIARNLKNTSKVPISNASRIVRTEGHRIQNQAKMDTMSEAKAKGADVVKQWDSTLDGKTRSTHRQLDGQIRELDEDFEVGGMKASAPGMFGNPAEDCNCRCALLQRARWALGNDFTKWDKESNGIVKIKAEDYDDFKMKYSKESERVRSNVQKNNESTGQEKAKIEPLLKHETAAIDYRAEKVTFKDLLQWKKSIGNVTDDEYSIIGGMNDAGYIRSSNAYKINKAMRDDTVSELSDASKKTIETLKEVINNNESDMDAILIRKVDQDYLKNVFGVDTNNLKNTVAELNNKKIGKNFTEKGFVSTSYKEGKNLNNNDDVLLDIYAPKRTKMFLTKNREESEIILQAGTEFEFRGAVLTSDNKIKLLLDVKKQANPLETIENTVKSSTMESTIVKDAIDSGKVSKTINVNKQNRHIKGSDGYIDGRSYIKGNVEDAQKFVDELSGTGKPIIDSKGNWTNKERVEASETLGVHINPDDNSETETKKATIVYSKTGSHIIPRKDE